MGTQLIRQAFLPLLLSLAVFCLTACKWTGPTPPRAVRGVIDLRGWDFQSNGPADLTGDWEFYWQRHLSPRIFHKQRRRPRPVTCVSPNSGTAFGWMA